MDFTQHNKINSCFPSQNRVMDLRQSPNSYNVPQYQKFAQAPSYPSYQPPQQLPYQQQHRPQNNARMQQQYGDGSDKVVSLSKCYKPYTFNTPAMNSCMAPQKNSFYDDPMMMNFNDEEQMVSMPDGSEDINIEFFQCTPPKALAAMPKCGKTRSNPFQPVLESMRKFSDTNTLDDCIKPALENHQTFFFSHNCDDAGEHGDVDSGKEENGEATKEEPGKQQQTYKSRTKIVSIPNGVRIVTEIVKNGACGNEIFRNFRQLATRDKWENKSKIVLDDGDSKQSNQADGNSCENEADDYFEERESLINL